MAKSSSLKIIKSIKKLLPKFIIQIFPISGQKRSSRNISVKSNNKRSLVDNFFIFLFFVFLELLYKFFNLISKKIIFYLKTSGNNHYLVCPIRGTIKTKVYDEIGNFTEEYFRIKIISAFLKKKFPRELIYLNYKIHIGHKGKNFFVPDLVLKKKDGTFFIIVEVKKNSDYKNDALNYQLNPAIKILCANYGLYYDGTSNSVFFSSNGEKYEDFDFMDIPN